MLLLAQLLAAASLLTSAYAQGSSSSSSSSSFSDDGESLCRPSLVSPKPAGVVCGVPGSVSSPSTVTDNSAQPTNNFAACRDSCYFGSFGCVSFSFDTATSTCTQYGEAVRQMGFVKSRASTATFYSASCFQMNTKVCGFNLRVVTKSGNTAYDGMFVSFIDRSPTYGTMFGADQSSATVWNIERGDTSLIGLGRHVSEQTAGAQGSQVYGTSQQYAEEAGSGFSFLNCTINGPKKGPRAGKSTGNTLTCECNGGSKSYVCNIEGDTNWYIGASPPDTSCVQFKPTIQRGRVAPA